MENKLGQEVAFPIMLQHGLSHDCHVEPGISKRFYAACAAMQGILANSATSDEFKVNDWGVDGNRIAQNAWHCADELLKQENE
jgi:hypothetical protein